MFIDSFMRNYFATPLFLFVVLVVGFAPPSVLGQRLPSVDASTPAEVVASEIERAESALATLTAAVDLADTDKAELQSRYTEAVERLKNAQGYLIKQGTYRAMVDTAVEDIEGVKQQLKELPSIEQAQQVEAVEGVEQLRKAVAAGRSDVAQLRDLKDSVEQQATRSEGRPVEIGVRLPEARAELNRIDGLLAIVDSDLTSRDIAERALLSAQREELSAESSMLKEELNGQTQRGDLLAAQDKLMTRQLLNAEASLSAYEELLNRAQMSEADRVISDVAKFLQKADHLTPEVRVLAEEVDALAHELKESAQHLHAADTMHDALSQSLSQLNRDFTEMQKVIQLGGLDGILSQVLVEQRRKIPNPKTIQHSLSERARLIREIRLDEFDDEQRLLTITAEEDQFPGSTEEELSLLLNMREELLNRLLKNQNLLVSLYSKVDITERNYLSLVKEVRLYLWEKLFWKKSSPALWSMESYEFNEAITWLFGPKRFDEFSSVLSSWSKRHPYFTGLYALLLIGLIVSRPRILSVIDSTAGAIRHTSKDKFEHTLRAIWGTLLLALPVPMVIGFTALALAGDPYGSDWLTGVGHGFNWAFMITLWGCFLSSACRPSGLGVVHYGWHGDRARMLRRLMLLSLLIGVPVLIIICCLLFDEHSLHFDVVGRFFYIGLQLWIVAVLWRIFSPTHGIYADTLLFHPHRISAKTKALWFPLLLCCPLVVTFLAIDGYFITALVLSLEFFALLGIATLGGFCYFSVVRWFMIRERKFALVEALEERRARLEQAALEKEGGSDSVMVEVKESELDLASVGKQTRRMMRSLFTIAVILSVWAFWSHTMPIDQVLGHVSIGGWLNPFDLFDAVAIMVIVTVVVKNLPGMLELAGLRATSLDVGTRYAITTIAQYVVLAIGLALAFGVLHINWSTFGWIATALSVGLGFGLQEIVANFVCGIILLFERPIRVGDVITINEVTGTVTQIRMRATTITNWDRQELVVPNKQFISDALINWTLSNATNRVIVEVGVAYGTDTVRAKNVLIEVAEAHPVVLQDPAPLATFEQFGDSSLNLKLRVYLPDLNNRIGTITDLHDTINERFAAEGIEISFPQRDIHIRTVPEGGLGGVELSK